MWRLQNKNVFITGAGRGIGKCLRENFEAAGANVLAPGRAEMDLSQRDQIERYLDGHEREIDVFIHCAAINPHMEAMHVDENILNHVFQVNVFSAETILKRIISGMQTRGWGRILLISSLYAIVAKEKRLAYCMSKNALTGMAKTLTLELAPYNILTNCIAPGYVMTDMTKKNLSEEELKETITGIPTGRLQSEQEIADLALFLCSDFNQSITGQLIAVDGGYTCK